MFFLDPLSAFFAILIKLYLNQRGSAQDLFRNYNQLNSTIIISYIIMTKLRTVLAPSILSADFANLQAQCQQVLSFGADSLHVDIMDGHFVNNLTLGPPIVASLRKRLPTAHLDCHLMVTHPQNYLQALAKSKINCFTFHFESEYSDLNKLVHRIKQYKIDAGISIKPSTVLPSSILKLVEEGILDKILIMTVQPGFGGQKFMQQVMPKVQKLRQISSTLDIQVDGGLNAETAAISAAYGANCVVAGSSVFNSPNRKQAISSIKKAMQQNLNKNIH